jgi:hypothetical protein
MKVSLKKVKTNFLAQYIFQHGQNRGCQKLGVFKNYEIFQKIFFFEKTRKNALNRE